jgi:hypothetical protein
MHPITRPPKFIFSKDLIPLVFVFPESKLHIFCHNSDISKPELFHPKPRTANNLNGCGFGMQQFWFWDVTVVEKRCVF